jgi:CMP/dCMP kinase
VALGFRYVDTGALYRALALLALRAGVPLGEGGAVAAIAARTRFSFDWDGQRLRVSADQEDLSDLIRRDEVGSAASAISTHPEVRAALLELQRAAATGGGVVMDGRDIGTVVLPHAEIKVFLDAELEERARRRTQELLARGEATSYEEVREALALRDRRDRERPLAPLRPAPDAVVLDTTHLTIEQARDAVLAVVRAKAT